MVGLIIPILIMVVVLVGFYKAIEKAGQPGWSIFVPIYSIIIMFRVGGRNDWWAVFIPIYNIIVAWQLMQSIAQKFGKSSGFGAGLFFLGGIFWPILGYGSAQYEGAQESNPDILDA